MPLITSDKVGARCRAYRKFVLRMPVKHVAEITGYSPWNIYAFETGKTHNYLILLWYLSMGMTIKQVLGREVI